MKLSGLFASERPSALRFPNTVDDLIDQLDKIFAETIPSPGDTIEKVMHAAGQRSVIRYLRTWRASPLTEPPKRPRGEGRRVPRQETQD